MTMAAKFSLQNKNNIKLALMAYYHWNVLMDYFQHSIQLPEEWNVLFPKFDNSADPNDNKCFFKFPLTTEENTVEVLKASVC